MEGLREALTPQIEEDTTPPAPWSYAPLTEDQVRWYWNKQPYSLKALYQQDIPNRANMVRFCNVDNARLEASYRERAEALDRAWWEELAELSQGPANMKSVSESNLQRLAEEVALTWKDHYKANGDVDVIGLLVKGGLWEVDLYLRKLRPCYWPGQASRVLRGTWFVEKGSDWVPLKETTAEELENAFRSEVWHPFKGHLQQHGGLRAARVDLNSLTNEAKGMYALFANYDEMYLCKDDSFTWLSRKINTSGVPGARLRRGYLPPANPVAAAEVDVKAEETDEYAGTTPISHLVFAIHGIGQNLSGSNIADDAMAVRNNLRLVAADNLGEEAAHGSRVEVLPIQWRKNLNLDADLQAEALMPAGVRSLRSMLHATCVEVVMYLTPLHCQDMLNSVVDGCNFQFARFKQRNPEFKGKVSILAHSLGTVLSYDILCNQPHLYAALEVNEGAPAPPPKPRTSKRPRRSSEGENETVLKPFSAADLEAPADGSEGNPIDLTLDDASEAQLQGSDLTDLSCMLSPRHNVSHLLPTATPEERRLLLENQRLELELRLLREHMSRMGLPGGSKASRNQVASTSADRQDLDVEIKPLNFLVDQFVCLGSPLGLFLALRKVNPSKGRGLGTPAAARLMLGAQGQGLGGDGLPAVNRMYNLYHPFDPVGYRMEPLVMEGAEKRLPVYAAAKGGKRLHVGLQEFGEDVSASFSAGAAKAHNVLFSSFSSLKLAASAVGNAVTIKRIETRIEEEEKGIEQEAADEAEVQQQAQQDQDSAVWRITDGKGASPEAAATTPTANRMAAGRLDFVLQTGNVENPWLSAISSHFGYWSSYDVALFLWRALHGLDVRQGTPKAVAAQLGAEALAPMPS
eukprot:jgi/Botrbrau1/13591/Bobra.0307s0010.1